MRTNVLLLVAAVVFIFGLTVYLDREHHSPVASTTNEAPTEIATKAEKAPDVTFTTLTGKTAKLSDYRGKTVILHFWASWCAPCIIEFPKLAKLASEKSDQLVVIAVSSDHTAAAARKFVSKYGLENQENFLVTWDSDKKLTESTFQTIKLPESIVIDASGNMVKKIVGDTDWPGQEINQFLDSLKTK